MTSFSTHGDTCSWDFVIDWVPMFIVSISMGPIWAYQLMHEKQKKNQQMVNQIKLILKYKKSYNHALKYIKIYVGILLWFCTCYKPYSHIKIFSKPYI